MAVTQQEIENRLWDAADELRVAMPEAQYSSVVFPLMFWKYLSDTWEHHHQEFLADNEGLDDLSAEEAREIEYRDYQSFEIPFIYPGTVRERRASWTSILATITQPGLGQRVRASLQAIETANPDKFSRLFGSMTWTSEEVLPGEVLAAVIQAMDRVPKMHEGNMSHDVLGGAYEYLLKRFSDGSGTRAGQFFTPREVVELIVEVLDPKGFESVYDPACGSGGMLIASANLLKARGGRGYTLSLYGQEAVPDTAGVARMNLFMHNLTQFQVEVGDTLKDPRFKKPDGSVATFNVIVANPPYSLKWKPWTSDPRAIGGVAPQSSADWAFVQHMIASMDPKKGRAGVVLPNGVLFRRSGQEGRSVSESLMTTCSKQSSGCRRTFSTTRRSRPASSCSAPPVRRTKSARTRCCSSTHPSGSPRARTATSLPTLTSPTSVTAYHAKFRPRRHRRRSGRRRRPGRPVRVHD